MKTIIKEVKTIQTKKQKQFLFTPKEFTKKSQIPVTETSAKKSMLKNLLISDLTVIDKGNIDGTNVYAFKSNLLETLFLIKENIVTKEKVLYQDEFILDNNTNVCDLLINKLAA